VRRRRHSAPSAGSSGLVRLFAAGLLLAGSAGQAADATDEPAIGSGSRWEGSLRASVWGRTRTLDGHRNIASGSAWLKGSADIAGGTFVAEGWARHDQSLRDGGGRSEAKLREAYYARSEGDWDVRLGRQILPWGRADEINPTDRLTPRDYTLLVPESSDQRLGLLAAKVTRHFGDMALTGIWMPGSRPHVLPVRPMPGVAVRSEAARHRPQVALKLERTGGDIDWSVSWFHGRDNDPDLAIASMGPSMLDLRLRQPRVDVLGVDAAGVIGRFSWRAEAAYSHVRSQSREDPLAKRSNLFAVVGADWDAGAAVNVNMQFVARRVLGWSDPRALADPMLRSLAVEQAVVSSQLNRTQTGASLRLSRGWLNDTLRTELQAVVSFTTHDFVLRPKLIYALDDRWKLTVGADVFRGRTQSYFGRLRDLSMGYAELAYAF
jgi:hypothetical protein